MSPRISVRPAGAGGTGGPPVEPTGPDAAVPGNAVDGHLDAEARVPYGRARDLLVAAVVAGCGVLTLAGSRGLPTGGDDGSLGPDWWPTVLGLGLLLAAGGIAAAGLLHRAVPDDESVTRHGLLQLGGLAALVICYGSAWQYFHFVPVTFVFVAALTAVLGSRGVHALVVFPAVIVGLTYGIFGLLLRVPL
ncbi:tripartite tricarboxylate transporter TctB family protein [Blastococcus saxobsidens]|uniref:Tripartite tricarboxylate transporter TctB family protein n=1 Tax=Blastococcus saxobsidens TaxID=138336 RepID=A0A4Q7Y7L5_9ACTN|nr:tripartite tricarboxylate transporter TctB family protein [Blastococcus saxobsidens]RZU32101.1 tripartite tricarboxylate transporter TctB family protein [Blastococcus saxobsidens]